MSDKIIENNQVTIMGKVATEFSFSHEVFGEGFYMSKGTTFHTVRRKQKAGKHNMRCSFPLFFCQHIYILYFFAFEMHTPNL